MSEWLWCAFDGHISLGSSRVKEIGMLLYFVKALWTIFTGHALAIHQVSLQIVHCTDSMSLLASSVRAYLDYHQCTV